MLDPRTVSQAHPLEDDESDQSVGLK
ncbi:hypothetical protein HYPGJ_20341 [Hyphomicrobium sp. GJ21]|nr:hypothetical protein HYPGJ_20341 [Hyphomicrobium sp. GJ21]